MSTVHKFGPRLTRELPVTASTPSGSPVVVGQIVGVALVDADADDIATVGIGGVASLPVGTTTAVAVGAPVYITSAYALTPTATSNTLFGYALTAKGTTAGEVIDIELVTP